jgi:dihydroxyacetone kinase
MDKEDINLQLSADEINLLLEGLGSMPFVKVYALIGKIQQQASDQLSKGSEPSNTAVVTSK